MFDFVRIMKIITMVLGYQRINEDLYHRMFQSVHYLNQ